MNRRDRMTLGLSWVYGMKEREEREGRENKNLSLTEFHARSLLIKA